MPDHVRWMFWELRDGYGVLTVLSHLHDTQLVGRGRVSRYAYTLPPCCSWGIQRGLGDGHHTKLYAL